MLSESEYQTYITGYPSGVVYAAQNPDSGDTFDFAGIFNGRLVYTVASLYDAAQPDGTLLADTQELYLGLAGLQLKAAADTVIEWVCQRAQDADALRGLLLEYEPELRAIAPFGRIDVRHVPVSDAQAT